jgi:hypothetical protein
MRRNRADPHARIIDSHVLTPFAADTGFMIIRRLVLIPPALAGLAVLVVILLLAANLYTYHRLTDEAPIAELTFHQLGPQTYEATLLYGDFCTPHTYTLHGDQWRLDAQFLKWKPWANLLGLDAMYRLERLGGRYRSVQDENTRPNMAHEIQEPVMFDVAAMNERLGGILLPVDTSYGSSTYQDMEEGRRYIVYRSQSGLFVRTAAPSAARIEDGGVIIEIHKSCAGGAARLRRVTDFLSAMFR